MARASLLLSEVGGIGSFCIAEMYTILDLLRPAGAETKGAWRGWRCVWHSGKRRLFAGHNGFICCGWRSWQLIAVPEWPLLEA